MRQAPPDRHQQPPGSLSHSDPEPERSSGRPPIWVIIIVVLLVGGFIALHLTGAVGPGAH